MKTLACHLILSVFLLFSTTAEEPVPSIQSSGGWTTMKFMTADRIKIDYVYVSDGSVIISIFHLFDRDSEEPVTFSRNLEVEGAELEDLSNQPMQIGYREGNLEFAQSICRMVPEKPGAKQIDLPKHVFSHIPEYWPFVLPYPVILQELE